MLIERIIEARLVGVAGPRSLRLDGGCVLDESAASSASGACLDAKGRLVLPGFVDAHVHLDKAFLLEASGSCAPTLDAAIRTVGDLRGRMPLRDVARNAERAVDLLVKNGVTAARVHVEIDPAVGLDLVGLHQELAGRVADRLELQLVAFPQRGFDLPRMQELTAQAMEEGMAVIGGAPYVDADPRRHLDIVFSLAEKYGAPIDLHFDFSDEPQCSLIGLLAERVQALGMQGRVTIGHVTTLAAMAPADQARALDLLGRAGIALIVLPATDLYLAGHGDPGTRSLAPIERARAAGVRVAIANNNIRNPFAPFGNGNLLQAAWLAAIMRRANDPDARRSFLEAITTEPAAILGLREHGPTAGARAHLAIVDAVQAEDVVAMAPPVLASLRGGRLVHSLTGLGRPCPG
jgi:cytosine deaminase